MHQEQKIAVTTTGKGGYTTTVQEHLQWTTTPYRRAPWGDKIHSNNCAGNTKTRIWSGRTGTSQCSTHYPKLHGNDTFDTYDCDHERHAGATKNNRLCTNQPSNAKKEALLLDLREKLHSRDQKLLIKESGTPRGSVLQVKNGWEWKGMWTAVRGNS